MGGSNVTFAGKSLTKADEARRTRIHAGHCMACIQRGIDLRGQGLVQWHHTAGKKRHDLTCGLCTWHHMARPFDGSHADMRTKYGPSLAEGSKPFHAEFGSNAELLARQNDYLGENDGTEQ
jgi:hypothetical protein